MEHIDYLIIEDDDNNNNNNNNKDIIDDNRSNENNRKLEKKIKNNFEIYNSNLPKNNNNNKNHHKVIEIKDNNDNSLNTNIRKINDYTFNISINNSNKKITKRKQPEKFPKYVRSIYNKIKEIKDETNDLIVKDNKSLKNISMNFSKTARPVIILNNKKERKVRPTSASTYYEKPRFNSAIINK